MRKWASRNAFTHSHIRAKVPPVGVEPAASTDAAQNATQLTKYEESKPEISNMYRPHRSQRHRVLNDLTQFSVRSVKILTDRAGVADFAATSVRILAALADLADFAATSVRIPTDLADLADFSAKSERSVGISQNSHHSHFDRRFSARPARSARIRTVLADPADLADKSARSVRIHTPQNGRCRRDRREFAPISPTSPKNERGRRDRRESPPISPTSPQIGEIGSCARSGNIHNLQLRRCVFL